jgi:thiol-disulfide isomerase/thioredoxin
MISRRNLLKTGAAAVGATMLSRPGLVMANVSDYGITGQPAPELHVDYWIDDKGDPTSFKLADHAGKWIFLKCFQSWCPGCHSHGFPALSQISEALAGNPAVAFAGIQTVFEGHYTTTVDKVRKIQLQYDLQMPMGHDPGLENGHPRTMVDYRTGGTPWMILINPEGKVIFNDYGIDVEKAIAFLAKQTS